MDHHASPQTAGGAALAQPVFGASDTAGAGSDNGGSCLVAGDAPVSAAGWGAGAVTDLSSMEVPGETLDPRSAALVLGEVEAMLARLPTDAFADVDVLYVRAQALAELLETGLEAGDVLRHRKAHSPSHEDGNGRRHKRWMRFGLVSARVRHLALRWLARLLVLPGFERESVGLSQAELARRTGLSQGHVSSLERGDPHPTDVTVRKLADGLGLPVTALLSTSPTVVGVQEHFDRRALVALRTLVGISQAGLARRTGVSQGHVSELERGDKRPLPATVRKLADGLGVPPTMLYSVTESLSENLNAIAVGLQVAAIRNDGLLGDRSFICAANQLTTTLAALGFTATGNGSHSHVSTRL